MATSTIQLKKAGMTYVEAENGITGGLRLFKDPNSRTVRAYGYFRRSTNIDTNTTIFTVPAGYRPSGNYALPSFLYTNGTGVAYQCTLYASDGTVMQKLGASVREGLVVGEWAY